MTARECMHGFLFREESERLPYMEWAMWWNLTMDRWHKEGLDSELDSKEVKRHFGLDYDYQIWIPNGLDDKCPKFKENGYISTPEEYEKLRPLLYPKNYIRGIKEQLLQIHEKFEKNGDITWATLSGFFWFPRQLFGIEDHLYSFYDYPELYHRICRDMVEYYYEILHEMTKYISPQFITFAEDMSYNLGPMISEELYLEFLDPYYREIMPDLKEKSIKPIIDTDGDVTKMIPWMIRSGIEGVLPLEHQAGVDVNQLTGQYPDFLFIGGFDKMVMKYGKEAMEKEFERILPAIRRGNYLPSVDHQTPPDVSLKNYYIYTELLRQYCGKECACHL